MNLNFTRLDIDLISKAGNQVVVRPKGQLDYINVILTKDEDKNTKKDTVESIWPGNSTIFFNIPKFEKYTIDAK